MEGEDLYDQLSLPLSNDIEFIKGFERVMEDNEEIMTNVQFKEAFTNKYGGLFKDDHLNEEFIEAIRILNGSSPGEILNHEDEIINIGSLLDGVDNQNLKDAYRIMKDKGIDNVTTHELMRKVQNLITQLVENRDCSEEDRQEMTMNIYEGKHPMSVANGMQLVC
jgi:hypothetical protein